jgi:hypothetical protein
MGSECRDLLGDTEAAAGNSARRLATTAHDIPRHSSTSHRIPPRPMSASRAHGRRLRAPFPPFPLFPHGNIVSMARQNTHSAEALPEKSRFEQTLPIRHAHSRNALEHQIHGTPEYSHDVRLSTGCKGHFQSVIQSREF